MSSGSIDYRLTDHVAHLRFTRPEDANAVNRRLASDLLKAMRAIESDSEIRAVSLTAEGKVFCAGGDLKEFHAADTELPRYGSDLVNDLHDAIYIMNSMPKPIVAGVRGAAGGAGLSLMAAADLAVAGQSAKFTMAYTRVGLTPDGASTYFISRHIGLRRMLELALTNRVLSADEAAAWGLVNRVVPDDDVDETADALAHELAAGSSFATGHTKRVIYSGIDQSLRVSGEVEAATIIRAMSNPDGREGIAAFVQKRLPTWPSA